jgi:hypothetical protein
VDTGKGIMYLQSNGRDREVNNNQICIVGRLILQYVGYMGKGEVRAKDTKQELSLSNDQKRFK